MPRQHCRQPGYPSHGFLGTMRASGLGASRLPGSPLPPPRWLLRLVQQVQAVDPDRPRFHVHPPQGWMNDPNGGCGCGSVWGVASCDQPISRLQQDVHCTPALGDVHACQACGRHPGATWRGTWVWRPGRALVAGGPAPPVFCCASAAAVQRCVSRGTAGTARMQAPKPHSAPRTAHRRPGFLQRAVPHVRKMVPPGGTTCRQGVLRAPLPPGAVQRSPLRTAAPARMDAALGAPACAGSCRHAAKRCALVNFVQMR